MGEIRPSDDSNCLRALAEWGRARLFWLRWLIDVNHDFWNNRWSSPRQKLWAYRRGFLSSHSLIYGLTGDNYRDYLSHLDYLRVQPINGRFSRWIDDKLTLKYLLYPFNQHLPRYYFHLGHNRSGRFVARLTECPPGYGTTAGDMIKLLESEGALAAKLVAGSQGKGFNWLSYRDQTYYLNGNRINKAGLEVFLNSLDGYILTEYLHTHPELGKIWSKSANTLRVVVINEDGSEPQIASSSINFGTERSGHADMMVAGGIGTIIDLQDGRFSRAKILHDGKLADCPFHPQTKVPVEGRVPFWPEIVAIVLAIGRYLPQLRFMAYDIIVTGQGFKIIEINSRPWVYYENYNQPFHTHPVCGGFFRRLLQPGAAGLESSKRQEICGNR